MTPLRTRILLADDHAVVRRGLRLVLDAEPDLQVVAEAADGLEALALALREDIQLAVLDVAMPGLTGLQVARELRARRPELRSLLLSMHDSEQYLFEALRAGADTAEFDAAKVERMSRAIADGSYQVNAEAIADKLIANAQEALGKVQR